MQRSTVKGFLVNVKTLLTGYGIFLAYVIATNLVIRPMVKQFNVPLLKDVL